MKKISKEEAKVGDYAYVDGGSSFCTGGYEKIKAFETRYDNKTGRPYEIVVTTDGEFRKDDGSSIKGATAYSIFWYAREDDSFKEKKKRLKELKRKAAEKKLKGASAIVEALNNIKMDGIAIETELCDNNNVAILITTEIDDEIKKLQMQIDNELY